LVLSMLRRHRVQERRTARPKKSRRENPLQMSAAKNEQHPRLGCLRRDSNALGLGRYRSSSREFKDADHKEADEQSDVRLMAVELIA
jgi:hypothetical protein